MKMRTWKDIKNKQMTPEHIAELDQQIHEELMTLRKLRKASGKSQAELANLAETTQAQLSRIESRSDHRLSTIRTYIEALGGELEIVAKINGQRIRLDKV